MDSNDSQSPIITYFVIWDEASGPTIIDKFLSNLEIDLENITLQIFPSIQTVFGNSSEVAFDKTNLILPLKSFKKVIKILIDAEKDLTIRGGRIPLVSIILLPLEFPELQLTLFNKVQENVIQQYIKENKVSLADAHNQMLNLLLSQTQTLNSQSENAFRDKDYLKVVEFAEQAVSISNILGMPEKSSLSGKSGKSSN